MYFIHWFNYLVLQWHLYSFLNAASLVFLTLMSDPNLYNSYQLDLKLLWNGYYNLCHSNTASKNYPSIVTSVITGIYNYIFNKWKKQMYSYTQPGLSYFILTTSHTKLSFLYSHFILIIGHETLMFRKLIPFSKSVIHQ